jgi:hypothetical protein
MYLHAAYPHSTPARESLKLLFFADRSPRQRAGHNGAKTLHGEHPVNRQAGQSLSIPGGCPTYGMNEGLLQIIQPLSR